MRLLRVFAILTTTAPHTLLNFFDIHLKIRAFWYQSMSALREEATQRNGAVCILFGNPNREFLHFAKKYYIFNDGVPLRHMAIHFCLLGSTLNPMEESVLLSLGRDIRLRLRIHFEG